MSYHTLSTKNSLNAGIKRWLKRGTHLGLGIGAFTPVLALANPTGGQVVAGHATIGSPSANGMVIDQTSQSAIINWQQFNIGQGQYVQFLQPSSSSVILNRVIGGGATSILGNLHGNGQVFLVNTNGVYFGKAATIDAQGFLASTLDIDDSDFLAHNYQFNKSGSNTTSDAAKTVVNDGTIVAHAGGYVVLAGDYTQNDGIISAQSGHVILASGAKSTLTLSGNSLVNYVVSQATLASLAGADNAGKLEADGGAVIMTADVANLLKATVVNNTGLIEARAISKAGGTIQLLASGGNINNAGTLDADANRSGLTGGTITLKGDERTTLTDTSKISATGQGADGGNLEISGNTISVRGTANLGHGGNMLLDPGQVSISNGSLHSGSDSPGGTSGIGHIGVKFIQTQLNKGTSITIAATQTIEHSSKATKITATKTVAQGGGGNLILNVDHGGQIILLGLNIDIAGNLDASVSPGGTHSHNAAMNFGRITANSISINAGAGDVTLAPAVTVSGILQPSLKATGGDIMITATNISSYGGSNLDMVAKGDIRFHGVVSNAGNVNLTASGEGILSSKIVSGKNISLKAARLATSHSFLDFSAASNLTIKGAIGTSASPLGANLNLKAGKTITLDHGIFTTQGPSPFEADITITGHHLAYTGKGAFIISAGYGNLTLDASIGSVAKPVAYAVDLRDAGYGLFLERSIYTNAGIDAAQHGSNSSGDSVGRLAVGNHDGKAIVISGKGAVTLQGEQVDIGDSGTGATITITADDGNAATHTDTLKIAASYGGSTLGGVHIRPNFAEAINSGAAAAAVTVDHSISLNAGQDVDISGFVVDIGAGEAVAVASKTATGATARANVSVTAGHDINLAGLGVGLHGGSAIAAVASDSKSAVNAVAQANLTFKAGHDFTVQAFGASLSAGYGQVHVLTDAVKQKAGATASGDVIVSAGHDIMLGQGSAIDVTVAGGNDVAETASINAAQSGAKATGVAHGDAILTAGDAIALTGTMVRVHGGHNVAGSTTASPQHFSCSGECNIIRHFQDTALVVADGKGAGAALTATGNVSLKAGAGGVSLTDIVGGVAVSGGGNLARGMVVSAGSKGGTVAADTEAKVVITTTGSIVLKGDRVAVFGGSGAAQHVNSHFSGTSFGSAINRNSSHGVEVNAFGGGKAKFTANASVSLNAGLNVSLLASGSDLQVGAAHAIATHMTAMTNGADGRASGSVDASVHVTATHGNINFTNSSGHVQVQPGVHVAGSADAVAGDGALASLKVDGGVHLVAGGAVSFNAHTSLDVGASGTAGIGANVHATSSSHASKLRASAALTALGNVSIAAGGAINMTAGSDITVQGDADVGFEDSVSAKGEKGVKASLLADGSVTLTAGGSVNLKASTLVVVDGGSGAAHDAHVAASSGGNAALTAKSVVDITAGGGFSDSATVGAVGLAGGRAVDRSDAVTADAGTAALSADGGVHLDVKGSVNLRALHANVSFDGGASAGYGAVVQATSGTATDTAFGNVSIVVGGAFGAVAGASLDIDAGTFAGESGDVHAQSKGADAALTADGGISLKAGGSVTLKARKSLLIAAANSAARSAVVMGSTGGIGTETAGGAITITTGGNFTASAATARLNMKAGANAGGAFNSTHHAFITADAGSASLAADDGIHVTAAGAITLDAGSSMDVSGSEGAGRYAHVTASSGHATLNALANVSFKAGGAFTANAGASIIYAAGDSAARLLVATATGTGATVTVIADSSITITAGGNIAFKAREGLSFSGSNDAAESAAVTGKNGGTATVTANAAFNMTGGGSLTANGGNKYVFFSAGDDAARGATVTGSHGTAILTADGGVHLTIAKNVNVTAGSFASISGGNSAGYGGVLTAVQGKATVTADDALTVTAGGAFTAVAGSHMSIYGGNHAGQSVHATASSAGAKATLTADGGAHITAKGGISLKTGEDLHIGSGSLNQGESAGRSDTVTGKTGGAATVTALSNVTLTAGGAFNASAGSSILIDVAKAAGLNDHLTGSGGTATVTADQSVAITAGSTLTLKAGFAHIGTHGNSLDIDGGVSAGNGGSVKATGPGAAATQTVNAGVSMTAGGAISLRAAGETDIDGGGTAGHLAVMHGSDSAAAAKTVDTNITIKAGGAFTGSGSELFISGGGLMGEGASINANIGKATFTGADGVSITAAGAMALTAVADLSIAGGGDNGSKAHVAGLGAKGVATFTADGSVDITAAALTITNSNDGLDLSGGSQTAKLAVVTAFAGGVAKMTASGALNIKVSGNISVITKDELKIRSGESNAVSAHASVDHGSGSITVLGGVNIAAGGAFAASGGSGLVVEAGKLDGTKLLAHGSAEGGPGVSKINALDALNITAGGALALNAGSGGLTVAGAQSGAQDAHLTGDGGAVAAVVTDGSVNLKGKTVSLTAGSDLTIGGGLNDAESAHAVADEATTTLSAKSGVTITAAGAFTAKAFSGLSIAAGGGDAFAAIASAANGVPSHSAAKTTFTADNSVNIKAGSLSLTAGSTVKVDGGVSAGVAGVDGFTPGIANLDAESKVSIVTTGAITVSAGDLASFHAGNFAAAGGGADASGLHEAGLTVNSSVSLTAGGAITLNLANGDLDIEGGSKGGAHTSHIGSASISLIQTVDMKAGGAFTVNGANAVKILAGAFAATTSDMTVTNGTATVDTGIVIKGSIIAIHSVSEPTITGLSSVVAGGLTESGGVSLASKGALTLGITGPFPPTLSSVGGPITLGGGGLPSSAGGVVIIGGVFTGLEGSGMVVAPGKPTPLPTLAVGGIVTNLQQVLSLPAGEADTKPVSAALKK